MLESVRRSASPAGRVICPNHCAWRAGRDVDLRRDGFAEVLDLQRAAKCAGGVQTEPPRPAGRARGADAAAHDRPGREVPIMKAKYVIAVLAAAGITVLGGGAALAAASSGKPAGTATTVTAV